ncbi:MAG: 2,4-dihydroxyhept-2-ene-1,7-dioic acid aldolase [Anaerolineales bacterium]|nr:2,4-dihydroxyhept-2-ene-1,7-dioic acid aldolase [Anaerolineales bacterium]
MRRNKLRELLVAEKPSFSTRVHSTWPSIVEIIGHTGMFDYVEFVAEYAPYDLYDLDNMCRAAELHDLGMMIKIDQEPRRFVVGRAVGSGFQSVLFADVRTVEEAEECVRSVRPETPEDGGCFGAATRRFAYMGYGGNADYCQALRDVVVAFMIEKKSTVDALEDILSVRGVDMVQWGGVDFSVSIGKPGARATPEVKAVERRVIETALRLGVPPRAELASVDDAKYYLDLGVRHFSLNTDISILFSWLKQNGEALRKVVGA